MNSQFVLPLSMLILTMLQELVTHMTQKDPSRRLTAEQYLSNQRDKAFPMYFYTFLGLYCQRFAQVPIIHSDDRVVRLCTSPLVLLNYCYKPQLHFARLWLVASV